MFRLPGPTLNVLAANDRAPVPIVGAGALLVPRPSRVTVRPPKIELSPVRLLIELAIRCSDPNVGAPDPFTPSDTAVCRLIVSALARRKAPAVCICANRLELICRESVDVPLPTNPIELDASDQLAPGAWMVPSTITL